MPVWSLLIESPTLVGNPHLQVRREERCYQQRGLATVRVMLEAETERKKQSDRGGRPFGLNRNLR